MCLPAESFLDMLVIQTLPRQSALQTLLAGTASDNRYSVPMGIHLAPEYLDLDTKGIRQIVHRHTRRKGQPLHAP